MQQSPGAKVLLMGPTGTGKTYCLHTFVKAGITPFILSTEPGIEATLARLPEWEHMHYHYISPANQPWEALIDSAEKINKFSYESLSKMDGKKRSYTQFIDILKVCNNFTCQRTGEEFGDIGSWGPDRAFIIDSLSGLNTIAMSLVVGAKPVKSQPEWQIAQTNLENFLQKLTSDLRCYFTLTSHVERMRDEVTGGMTIGVSTLGQKLAPRIPRFFDDVVLAVQREGEFYWATIAPNVDLKARNLKMAPRLAPTFEQIAEGKR